MPEGVRLQKLLARAGFGSRRTCESLISAGRVTVDGVTARLGDRADPERQQIALDGVPVVARTDLVYYLLNKPAGVVTTARDPQGRPTVVALVPGDPRVFPVGRLDVETEGLLLLTNDGELGQLLAHPRHGVEKTYLVEVEGDPSDGVVARLRSGIALDDGTTAPARVRVVSRARGRSALELTIHEGRKRQVRRMCAAVGLSVNRLVRTRIGPLADTRLAPGAWRNLRPNEVRALYEAAHSGPGSEHTSH
ncbi:MAG TPA: pseudouridine synthase [Acidimicrobiia bacterium]